MSSADDEIDQLMTRFERQGLPPHFEAEHLRRHPQDDLALVNHLLSINDELFAAACAHGTDVVNQLLPKTP